KINKLGVFDGLLSEPDIFIENENLGVDNFHGTSIENGNLRVNNSHESSLVLYDTVLLYVNNLSMDDWLMQL
ncbi:12113_t:CDS:2, partial [Dentiscutata erythropus]